MLNLRKNLFMRKLLLTAVLLLATYFSFGQEYKSNIAESERIKKDTCYYWCQSEGNFESVEDAEESVVDGLLTAIRKGYKSNIVPVGDNTAMVNFVFDTFKSFLEQNIQYLTLREGDENEVFAYISKEEFRNECEQRKEDIDYYLSTADIAFEKENLGDALRNYYIAMMLCCAHPYGNSMMINDEQTMRDVKLVKWLSNRIDGDDGILSMVRFNVVNWTETDDNVEAELAVSSVTGIPLSNINIRYNNGRFNQTCNVTNGRANLTLFKNENEVKELKVEVDMSYSDVKVEPVASMLKYLRKKVDFSKCEKTVKKPNLNAKKDRKSDSMMETKPDNSSINSYMVSDDIYIKNMRAIEDAIRRHDYESVRDLFTPEGYDFFMKLKDYGTASVIGKPDYKMFAFNGEVICRSIPMLFTFNRQSFSHDVVFRFDMDSKQVSSISFRLTDTAEDCIWNNEAWNIDSRLHLVNFLEDYQTAYAFKQIDYLDKIFSDNALIIIGHVVEEKPISSDGRQFGNNKKVEYTRKSKDEYIGSLRTQFKNKSYINIHFTDLNVRHAANDDEEVFGVQVHQYYHSSNYSDDGYLFLMVDLREELPIIHVRTWQPGKTDINDLINLRDVL